MRRKIVAGNWKLHGDRAFAKSLAGGIAATPAPAGVERVVMPPFPYLAELAWQFAGKGVELGAQEQVVTAVLDPAPLLAHRERFPAWMDADAFSLDPG